MGLRQVLRGRCLLSGVICYLAQEKCDDLKCGERFKDVDF